MRSLSDVQQRAACTELPNVALSAGAGSGKTSVIVERIINLISASASESPSSTINNILAVTFTDKAARELKERLVQRLTDDAMLEERRQIETAFICTIHALCARLLQENPFEAGLNPGFEVLAGEGSNDLIRSALSQSIQIGAEGHSDYSFIIRTISQWGSAVSPDLFLMDAVIDVLLELRGSGCFVEDLMQKIGTSDQEYRQTLSEKANSLVGFVMPRALAALKTIELLMHAVPVKVARNIQNLVSLIHRFNDEPQLLERINVGREVEKSLASLIATGILPQSLQESLVALQFSLQFAKQLKPVDRSLQEEAFDLSVSLMSLVVIVWKNYTTAKSNINAIDIDDLQELAVRLLEGNANVAKRYRERFKHIIVDEFQDTSLVQMRLLNSLRGPNKDVTNQFFVVGDRQQSIYSFRNANPDLFGSLCREFGSSTIGSHITLEDNYRTHPSLLMAINGLFTNLWANTDHPLQHQIAMRAAEDDVLRFELLISAGLRGDYYRRDEAAALANRILDLVNSSTKLVYDRSNQLRRVQYGDIAIVMRSLKDLRYIEQEFLKANIPHFVIGGVRGYFSRSEIRDVVNVLALITEPHDDLAFAALLRSPFVGLSMDSVTDIVNCVNSALSPMCLYMAVQTQAVQAKLGEHQSTRILTITRLLDSLRDQHSTMRPSDLLQRIVDETEYDSRLLVRANGRRKLANLRKLQALAASEETYGVRSFIQKLQSLTELSEREGDAPTEEEDANVVRLLTIHSAKGLEFPVVIVTDLGRPLMRRENRAFVCDGSSQTLGVSVDGVPDIIYQLLVSAREERERAEYLRLLYVAMTRARDYLILAGDVIPVKGFNWASYVFPSLGILEEPRIPQVVKLVGGHSALVSPISYYARRKPTTID